MKTYILDANSRYFGLDTLQLMENAGHGVALEVEKRYGKGKKIGIFCGLGNNGGDGFVAARFLAKKNDVTVLLLGTPDNIKTEEARKNWNILEKTSIKKIFLTDSSERFPNFDVYIDAMLGVGVKGELREPYKTVTKKLKKFSRIVSIDVPTGDLKPEVVFSMHYPKTENAVVIDIGIPKEFERYIGPGDVKYLKKRKKNSHKGENGRILVVGGSGKYHGAPVYAGLAASKIVDLVYIKTLGDERVFKKYPDFILSENDDVDSIVIGCGLGISENSKKLVNSLIEENRDKSIVLDADALKVLEKNLLGENCVITPHKGEFERLFGVEAKEENVLKMALKYNCIIVLKGKKDVVCQREIKYNFTGNEGMTTGGTGDVLAGIIGGFACKNDLFSSACAGVFVNGLAGDFCYSEKGVYYTAKDVVEKIPEAILWCEKF